MSFSTSHAFVGGDKQIHLEYSKRIKPLTRRRFIGETAALITTAGILSRHRHAVASDAVGECPSGATYTDRKLSKAEQNALRLAALAMLPRPLPANGPSEQDIVDNLARFVGNADAEMLAPLRQTLALLGLLAPALESNIDRIAASIERTLRQKEASFVKTQLDALHKVAVLGYYSHPKADALVGYKRPKVIPRSHQCLATHLRPSNRIFDVAIVGAGVAGSLLAERLTREGKTVLLLEAGPYVAEKDIDNDELVWISRLQKGSGLQRANADTPFAFPVLQAACVGGGGMINNAVCFQMPEIRLDSWLSVGFPISKSALRAAYQHVASELPIVTVSQAMETTGLLNPSLDFVDLGPQNPPSNVNDLPKPGLSECLVNLQACIGCGLCNTGCGSERKRNALQVYLPTALSRGDLCELVPNAKVERIVLQRRVVGAPLRVSELAVRTRRGDTFNVRAREFVLAAGAIHTTALLLQSPDIMNTVGHYLPLGQRFFANVASPVLGFFDDPPIHTKATLQLTHYYYPDDPRDAFLIEDLYNPPGQAALVMPGYGETHAKRMRDYARTTLTGAVVPTKSFGAITLDKTTSRPLISLPLSSELPLFRKSLKTLANAMLRGRTRRPKRVVAGVTGGGYEMKTASDIEQFGGWLSRFDQLALSTGHPQGGSAMSDDPSIGVVDKAFRLRGFANLRICDASLFPLVAGVNPQWTVMALADHCGAVMNGQVHP